MCWSLTSIALRLQQIPFLASLISIQTSDWARASNDNPFERIRIQIIHNRILLRKIDHTLASFQSSCRYVRHPDWPWRPAPSCHARHQQPSLWCHFLVELEESIYPWSNRKFNSNSQFFQRIVPTVSFMSRTCSSVAPCVENPVEVLTYSAPAK